MFRELLVLITICHCFAQLTQEEKDSLLNAHNEARSAVNPSAANMSRMEWDDAIAGNAQTIASRCNFGHSQNRERTMGVNFNYVGENIYLTSSRTFSGESLADAVNSWVDEESSYTFSTNLCTGVCGHYTQVVWANSYKVGCGYQSCSTVSNAGGITSGTLVVCQYGPGGNFIGQSPYVSGPSCSQCPAHRPFCRDGLCGTESSGGIEGTESSGGNEGTESSGGNEGTEGSGGVYPCCNQAFIIAVLVVMAKLFW